MHPIQKSESVDFRADLHSHTLFSDGTMSPQELIDLAIQSGLNALSITDHDTVEAYHQAIPYAKSKGFILGTGVEFSTEFKKHNVHILGYDIDVCHPFLLQFCTKQHASRKERNLKMLEKLRRFRFDISASELESLETFQRTIGRPHIAKIMVEKGYVRSIQEAFSLYLGDGKCCYQQGHTPSVAEAIDVIKQAGGKAFIAHPHLFEKGVFVKELLTHSFDGIECYYARCSKEKERRWLKIAAERGLLISGGSDFHGATKPHIPLGCSWVAKDEFSKIFSHHVLS